MTQETLVTSPTELAKEQFGSIDEISAEKERNQRNFLSGLRKGVGRELKLTFTLPNPVEYGVLDTAKDFGMKAMGIGGVYVGRGLLAAGEHGRVLHSPGETQQAFHAVERSIEGVGIGAITAGAAAILLANRIRSK